MIKQQVYPNHTLPAELYNYQNSYRFMSNNEPEKRLQTEYRKKIEHYSFMLTDKIGKGYSSTVYKGLNDLTRTSI